MNDMTMNESYTPADKWLDILNKKYPNIWSAMKKSRESMVYDADKIPGKQHLKDIPEWVEMPYLLAPFMFWDMPKYNQYKISAYLNASKLMREKGENSEEYLNELDRADNEVASLASMYLWRKTKGVYRFAPEIYEELINQPLDCNLQMQSFYRLPEWAVYIETPGLKGLDGTSVNGFIAYIDYHVDYADPTDKSPCLNIMVFTEGEDTPYGILMPFTNNTLQEVIDKIIELNEREIEAEKEAGRYTGKRKTIQSKELTPFLIKILNLTMYLCSEEPDILLRPLPQGNTYKKHKNAIPKGHRKWDVGIRISKFIKKYKHTYTNNEDETETGRSIRPHIRRAHWHTYWVGPKNEEYPKRMAIAKWLPPIPVNIHWQDELPVNIKKVEEQNEKMPK